MLPNFIIIGVQRGGTTSMYKYITKHPKIIPALRKEIHFFDIKYGKGISWYQSQFMQNFIYCALRRKKKYKDSITGEATPYYIYHPHVVERILKFIPNVKLIVLLRNPVERAYSHYNHEVRLKIEHLSFEDSIKEEPRRLEGEIKKMEGDESYYSFNHQHFSYLQRGIYIEQVERWAKKIPKEQMLILSSEDFYSDSNKICNEVFNFLNLPNIELNKIKAYNKGSNKLMREDTRKELTEYFKPYNEKLYKFLNRDLRWK